MSEWINVSDVTPRISYTASASQTAFPVPFVFFANSDLKVYKNTTLLTLATDYTVTGAEDEDGGNVTLLTGATVGDSIMIVREVPLEQTTHIPPSGPLDIPALNIQLSKFVAMIQQLFNGLARSLRLADDVPGTLEVAAPVAGEFLKWNATEDGVESAAVILPVGSYAVSTQSEAEAGTLNNVLMTPLRTTNHFDFRLASQVDAQAGTSNTKWMSPLRVDQFFQTRSVQIPPTVRVAPTPFTTGIWSSFTPYIYDCGGPGDCRHSIDIEAIFDTLYSSLQGGQDFWVDFANGSDANPGTIAEPFKTFRKAMTAVGVRTIYLMQATYVETFLAKASDNTVGGGTIARAIKVKAWGGNSTAAFTNPGQAANAMTWTSLGGGTPTCYGATPSGSQDAHTILISEGGKSTVVPYYTTIAEVNTKQYGWTQDAATKAITICWNADNINTRKNDFTIYYRSSASAMFQGCRLYVEGVQFLGMTDLKAVYESSFRPIVFLKNCSMNFGDGFGLNSQGGLVVMQGVRSTLNAFDGFNTDNDISGQVPESLEIDSNFSQNGLLGMRRVTDQLIAFPGSRNIQGSSSHTGNIIRINGTYTDNLGQNVADTNTLGATWMLGCDCRNPFAALQANTVLSALTPIVPPDDFDTVYTAITLYANSWLDGVIAGGPKSDYGVQSVNGTVKTFGLRASGTLGATSGTVTTYDPTAP